jgi:hypothetical protein
MWLGYAFLRFLASTSPLFIIVLVYALNFLGEEHGEEHGEHHH